MKTNRHRYVYTHTHTYIYIYTMYITQRHIMTYIYIEVYTLRMCVCIYIYIYVHKYVWYKQKNDTSTWLHPVSPLNLGGAPTVYSDAPPAVTFHPPKFGTDVGWSEKRPGWNFWAYPKLGCTGIPLNMSILSGNMHINQCIHVYFKQ